MTLIISAHRDVAQAYTHMSANGCGPCGTLGAHTITLGHNTAPPGGTSAPLGGLASTGLYTHTHTKAKKASSCH